MKKILFGTIILLVAVFVHSCGKSGRDISYNPDRVDALFSQLKYEPAYKEYYGLVKMNSEIIMANSKRSGRSDTAVLNNKELTLKEKYKQLNYSGYDSIEANTMRLYHLHNIIAEKYPEFKTLSEPENRKLMMLSKKFYGKSFK